MYLPAKTCTPHLPVSRPMNYCTFVLLCVQSVGWSLYMSVTRQPYTVFTVRVGDSPTSHCIHCTCRWLANLALYSLHVSVTHQPSTVFTARVGDSPLTLYSPCDCKQNLQVCVLTAQQTVTRDDTPASCPRGPEFKYPPENGLPRQASSVFSSVSPCHVTIASFHVITERRFRQSENSPMA